MCLLSCDGVLDAQGLFSLGYGGHVQVQRAMDFLERRVGVCRLTGLRIYGYHVGTFGRLSYSTSRFR